MKMVAYRSGHVVGAVDTSDAPVPGPEIEISQKTFLVRKLKLVVYRLGHLIGAVDTSHAHVPRPEIEILQKNFFGRKINGRIPFRIPCRCS